MPRGSPPRPARILLAEDDAALRELVARRLEQDGHAVTRTENGAALLDAIGAAVRRRQPPQAIVTDLRMPGLTGADVLAGLKDSLPALPVIVITAFGSRATHRRLKELGAHRVLDKPFDLDQLADCVRAAVAP